MFMITVSVFHKKLMMMRSTPSSSTSLPVDTQDIRPLCICWCFDFFNVGPLLVMLALAVNHKNLCEETDHPSIYKSDSETHKKEVDIRWIT